MHPARPSLVSFLSLEAFWKRHVCPATTRPHSQAFRPGISAITEKIARASYSVVGKLLDADDSLAKVLAGDLGPRYRNWRDAIEAAGNALQLTTELQFAVADKNAKKPTAASLAGPLGVVLDPFPDWKTHWAADRDKAAMYRNYLVHEGLVYTVTLQATGEVLVLGSAAFAAGVNWMQADASYNANPGHWQPLGEVALALLGDTMAFIDLTYGRPARGDGPAAGEPSLPGPVGVDRRRGHGYLHWPCPRTGEHDGVDQGLLGIEDGRREPYGQNHHFQRRL